MRGTILFTQYCKQKRVELGSTILVACTVYQSTGGSFSKCMNETSSTCTGAGIGTGSSNTAMRNLPVSGIYSYQESTDTRNLPIPLMVVVSQLLLVCMVTIIHCHAIPMFLPIQYAIPLKITLFVRLMRVPVGIVGFSFLPRI